MSVFAKKIMISLTAGLAVIGGTVGTTIVLSNLALANMKNYNVTYSNLVNIRSSILNNFSKNSNIEPLTIEQFIQKVNDGSLKQWIKDNYLGYFQIASSENPFDFNLSLTENQNDLFITLTPLENMALKMSSSQNEYDPSIVEFNKNKIIFKLLRSDFFNEQLFSYAQLNSFKQKIIANMQTNKITFEQLSTVSNSEEKTQINNWIANLLGINNIFDSIEFIKLNVNNSYQIKITPNSDYVFGFANNQSNTTNFIINRRDMTINFNNVISLSNEVLTSLHSKVANYIQQKKIDYFEWLEHIQNQDSTYQELITYIYNELNILSNNTLPTNNIINSLELLNDSNKLFSLKIIPEAGYSFISNSEFYDKGNILLSNIDFYSYIQFTDDNLFVFYSKLQQEIDTNKYNPEQFKSWIESNEFKNYLSINLSTANNTKIDISKVSSITYDIDSNVITFTPETMYKFEILDSASNVTVNDQGQMMISNLNLFEHLDFVKLSDFFVAIQEFIKTNKFTNEEFLDYVGDSSNLDTLKKLVADNLYVSETRKININKISNVNISNNNLTITLDNGYAVYSAEVNENVTLATNILTITNLKFYTITNIVKLSELFNYIQSIIDNSSNKFTESELSDYITDNQDTLKTEFASKIYINEYENIPASQITSIALDENNQVKVSLDSNYIKYNVELYENVSFENDELVIKNLVYYNAIKFTNLTTLFDAIQNEIQTSKFTKMEFSSYVTNNNEDLKSLIANNLYISDSEKLSVDNIVSVSFDSNSNQLSIVLNDNYLKYSINTSDNITLTGYTLTISNLRYYTLIKFTSINTLFNAIQNKISSSSNKYTVSEFRNYVTNNNDEIKKLVANNLSISPTEKLNESNIVSVSLNESNDLEIALNSDYMKYSLASNTNVTLENDVLTISNLVYYTTTNLTKLSELYNYVQNFISTNKYTPNELKNYISSNLSTFKTNLANKLYISNTTTISSSLITSVSLNNSNQLQITLDSTNKKYTIDSYTNASLSNTTITISNLTFYTSISFSGLDTIRSKYQELITNNSYTTNDFTIYTQNNNSNLRNIFINNLTTSTSGPGSWSSSWVSSTVSFNGSSISVSLTLPANYKYSWTSASNVSFSNNTFTFSSFSWYSPSSTSYFNWNGTTIIGLSSAGNSANITNLVIPNNCTAIGNDAFKSNKKLTSVQIPSSVKTIGSNAFYGTNNITSLTFAPGVTTIGTYAFTDTQITTLDLPHTVTTLDFRAFCNNKKITTIYLRNTGSINVGDGGLSYLNYTNNNNLYVYVYASSASLNKYAFGGTKYCYVYFRYQSQYNTYLTRKNNGQFNVYSVSTF